MTTVVVLAALWAAVVVLAAVFQRQLIYLPTTAAPEVPSGVEVETIAVTTSDGLDHEAWFLPAVGEPVATVFVAPGNAGNRAARVPMAEGLVARGHSVVLLDYRGYGGNPGSPAEDDLVADARTVLEAVVARDDVDPARVVYLGESLGTGVVAGLAAQRAPAALVLRSPFPELADVGRSAYPFLPVRTLLRDRYPVSEQLETIEAPVLVIAGDADRIVPTRLSRRVAERARAELVEIEGAGHNDAALFTGTRLLDAIDDFVRAHLDAGGDH
ncbi:MAG: alpha/beta fold hydrolase [Nitriliruptoraceae bacterium]|nr:alpha/beta fold hydrolase [Nitriliruptoraceae bacterium]